MSKPLNQSKAEFILAILFLIFLGASCRKEQALASPNLQAENLPPVPTNPTLPFGIVAGELLQNGQPVQFKGVNALNTFGIGDHNLMDEWRIEIVREFIGNLREQPIAGDAIQGANGAWLHPLQNIVDENRRHHKVTMLCPFAWVEQSGKQTFFTGLNPSAQSFYGQYKLKMKDIANHFKNQPDVWIEVWNEPYHWNNENGYSHELWLKDQKDMVDNLRRVVGFENIILVPGNEQGQSESAILSKGDELLAGRYNLLFDLHAYEKWLINTSETGIIQRIQALKNRKCALLFGEIGVINSSGLMQTEAFLAAVDSTKTTTLAWLWNKNSSDPNALLDDVGQENNVNNNNWGSTFKRFLQH